ncbi:hypothetical protein [Stygiolobus caldivivus]|uniref:Uncharacterized protein n=1 Tax=Stygiolobus caldivivus TaxID=2824673 RepID=A0A8D5ZHI5_9CREN|nr:hypothetical protein [Stygiolobus caldivivus]BCU69734.1 hypothetical protein KN1_10310 [Stygiolobus caldivivus]
MYSNREPLDEKTVKAWFGYDTFSKGEDYYNGNSVLATSILKVFIHGNVDEATVQEGAGVIRGFEHKISRKGFFTLLEGVALKCENFGCFYDDYWDNYYNGPLLEVTDKVLVEKDWTRKDVERPGKIIDRNEYDYLTVQRLN